MLRRKLNTDSMSFLSTV